MLGAAGIQAYLLQLLCRNRHCPQWQTRAKEDWLAKRRQELLPVPYFHLVFTLPHALHPLIGQRPRLIHEMLFGAASATLTEFGANPRWLGGTLAFSLVLHTWNERLVGMDATTVRFRVRATAGKRVLRVPAEEFIERFLLHVLPDGFKRTRHYAVLAPAAKATRLELARQALSVPAPDPLVTATVEEFLQRVGRAEWARSPHCGAGRFVPTAVIPPLRQATPQGASFVVRHESGLGVATGLH